MNFNHYHFVGIGGIGMSALARILLEKGISVTGSDSQESKITSTLSELGAKISIGHDSKHVESGTLIYSSAVSDSNPEMQKAKMLNLPILHRSDLLDLLMRGKNPLMVTGTHGKTTTAALLSWVLLKASLEPSFVIGGYLRALETNGVHGCGDFFVAEADESDGSFLKSTPFGAIITNCEAEHLDFWGNFSSMQAAFKEFSKRVKNPNQLVWCGDDPALKELFLSGLSYGFQDHCDYKICNFKSLNQGIVFDIQTTDRQYLNVFLPLSGVHNALNATAVFALSLSIGVDPKIIMSAFSSFPGVRRRLEEKGKVHFVQAYDDYAHHPTEVNATLCALKAKYPNHRLVCYFQPHRYSRLKDLFDLFAKCFSKADLVLIGDIYAAGEKNPSAIHASDLARAIHQQNGPESCYIEDDLYIESIAQKLRPYDIFVTLGAGSITNRGEKILSRYQEIAPKWKVGVLYGGKSSEHEISKISALNIFHAIERQAFHPALFEVSKLGVFSKSQEAQESKITLNSSDILSPSILQEITSCDVVIPVFHGPPGEDGTMQGFLEVLEIPYVGCDVESSALCMNKAWTKYVALAHGVPVVPFKEKWVKDFHENPLQFLETIEEEFSYPIWVKPSHLGSSIGVIKVENRKELEMALEKAFSLDEYVLVETHMQAREIEYGVLGNNYLKTTTPLEILTGGNFYDFEKKYGASAMGVEIPAKISEDLRRKGEKLAETVYKACHCKGLARVDFFLSPTGEFYLNEINTIPGFTANSGYPKMWEHMGMLLTDLLSEMILLGFAKKRSLQRTQSNYCSR